MTDLSPRDELLTAIFDLNLPKLATPLALAGDWMVVGDVHAPFTDIEWAIRVGKIAERYLPEPRNLLIAGDLFDMTNFSTYMHVVTPPSWTQEREAVKALLRYWRSVFARVEILMGNHDRRMQKWLAGAFDETDILGLVVADPDHVRASNYGWATIQSGGVPWRVTHPRNYSINQLVVLDQIAQKHQTNVIGFHEHHTAVGWERYKNFMVVNGGCLVDPGKLAYVVLDDSKSAGMARGFVMLRNGTPYVFGEAPFTDWRVWLSGTRPD